MIKIVPLQEKHIKNTAYLHWKEMPEDLASKMGYDVVMNIFHQGMLLYPGGISKVALDGEKVVGFVFAQIDFKMFSDFQRSHNPFYYSTLMKAFLKKPWLLVEAFAATRYLSGEKVFTNLGPLLVSRDYRGARGIEGKQISLATCLTRDIFSEIRMRGKEASALVMTMIRPGNFSSIAAVSSGARLEGFKSTGQGSIFFGSDERKIFKYSI